MWPHTVVVGIGESEIMIGTDDEALVAFLEPWRIDDERMLVDVGIELHPAPSENRSGPRKLPNLRHGSDYIASTDDTELLRTSLLRILAALAQPTPWNLLRVGGMVLECDGRAYIVPLNSVKLMAHRQLLRLGFRPYYAQTTLVDPFAVEVIIDAPLGSGTSPLHLPLAGLYLTHRRPQETTTPAIDVTRLLGNVVNGPGADARQLLVSALHLTLRLRPCYLTFGAAALENELTALVGQ